MIFIESDKDKLQKKQQQHSFVNLGVRTYSLPKKVSSVYLSWSHKSYSETFTNIANNGIRSSTCYNFSLYRFYLIFLPIMSNFTIGRCRLHL